jgi:hypothetical protein
MLNADPEWQTGSVEHNQGNCDGLGLLEGEASQQGVLADAYIATRDQTTSASLLTLALNINHRTYRIFKVVSKLPHRNPDKA